MTYKVCPKLYLNRICITECLRRPIPCTSRSHVRLYIAMMSQFAVKVTSIFGKKEQEKALLWSHVPSL